MPKRASHFPTTKEISRIATTLVAQAKAANQRRILVLAGEGSWGLQAAQVALRETGLERVLWITQKAPEGVWAIPGTAAHQVLGRESDAAVFDAHSGFDPDAFGAIAGTVRGGGLLLLLTPPLAAWPDYIDPYYAQIAVYPYQEKEVTGRFLKRLVRLIHTADDLTVIEQGVSSLLTIAIPNDQTTRAEIPGNYGTQDQRQAVEAIVKVATGHRRRPLVMTSDRGRGKSAALGIAAAQLLQQGLRRIIVTAPRRSAVEPVFKHAGRNLIHGLSSHGCLRFGETRLEFVSPDELTLSPQAADLVMVDEAAAIPTPILERLLSRYARIAFATTVHGYEGAGRGFAVRFHQVLNRQAPQWRAIRLETPIRWAHGDPVERFSFRALMLDTQPADEALASQARAEDCVFERLDRDKLVTNEGGLSELFALLVLAHYQTRPADLRHLLDGPNLGIYVLRYRDHIIATALVAEEGDLDSDIASGIYQGRRRVRGHLLPQTLAAHVGLVQASAMRAARIIRIAVHPAAQRRGLGTRLLNTIVRQALDQGLDYIGSSFGATVELLRFWHRSTFLPVRLGITRGATSGAHSVVVLQPLSTAGETLYATARQRFIDHFPQQLSDPLRDLDPELAGALLQTPSPPAPVLDPQDWRDIITFAFALRGYEVSLTPIWKLTCAALADPKAKELLETSHREILTIKVLQRRNWSESAMTMGLPGRAAVVELLRRAVQPLIQHYGDSTVHREIRRLVRE
ncbi:MAG: tRNA(Met) cytidine acetyltransferase [Gammaproteobacteria bacterium]|nr:tRNA(Met) cytidine acetyltransferase [Gammaproteobacteria bacterium]